MGRGWLKYLNMALSCELLKMHLCEPSRALTRREISLLNGRGVKEALHLYSTATTELEEVSSRSQAMQRDLMPVC